MATPPGTTFGELLKRLRLAAGLTQERLAERAGMSVKAVSGLEQDPHRTPRLDTVARLADALRLDQDERARLLAAARPEMSSTTTPTPEEKSDLTPADRPTVVPLAPPWQDWGEAPDIGAFHGRALELATLTRWVVADGCRLVAILGMGGIGKTALTARLARELAAHFEAVYWRSLRNAPPSGEWLAGAILFLSTQQVLPAEGEEARLRQLLELLRARRNLLVLDNLETVLQPGAPELRYRKGYEGYGQVLHWLGEAGHQSCLLVTSRELPPEIGSRESAHGPLRALRLGGIDVAAGKALLADKELVGDAAAWEALVAHYGGNALALRMAGQTIRDVFGGEIVAFLAEAAVVFGDIRRLLEGQVARLSPLEQSVLDWLAVEREPVDFGALAADLGPALPRGVALEAVEGLRRHSLLERGEQGATFTLQPVVLEHATERLVQRLAEEIARGQPARLVSHAVIKAQAKDYVRRSQERLIGAPILQLLNASHDQGSIGQRLLNLLEGWRPRSTVEQGYGPGNVVNLLRLLRGDLRELDLSRLAIRQAYLAEVDAQDARLVNAHLAEAVLADAFSLPVSMALSGDSELLAAGTSTGQIWLWQVADRTLLATLEGHTGPAWGVALASGGRLLASSGADGTVRLWETGTGRPLATLQGHTGAVLGVALASDGHLLASGGADGTVRLWDTNAERLLATLEGHTGPVRGMALASDGRLLASGGGDGTVRLWEVPSGRLLATLQGHTGLVRGMALSADGHLLASGSGDGVVRLWEVPSGRLLATLQGHTGLVRGMALSADGHLLASGSGDGVVRLWDTRTAQLLATWQRHTSVVRSVALSADGHLLASGGWDGTVHLWETHGSAKARTLRPNRRYERMDITGLTGVTAAQRDALLALGAVERSASARGSEPAPADAPLGSGIVR